MVGWHHWLNGHEFVQTQGDSGQGKPDVLQFMESQSSMDQFAEIIYYVPTVRAETDLNYRGKDGPFGYEAGIKHLDREVVIQAWFNQI